MIEWESLFNKLKDIDNVEQKPKKIKKDSNMDNYYEITYDNINDLQLGTHIKYLNNGKICNGGFLLKITYDDDIDEIILLVKSNIVWNLRLSKYHVYAKDIEDFNKSTQYNTNIFKKIRDEFHDDIELRKKQLIEEQNKKIYDIRNNKKNYKIQFLDV